MSGLRLSVVSSEYWTGVISNPGAFLEEQRIIDLVQPADQEAGTRPQRHAGIQGPVLDAFFADGHFAGWRGFLIPTVAAVFLLFLDLANVNDLTATFSGRSLPPSAFTRISFAVKPSRLVFHAQPIGSFFDAE